MPEPEKKSIRVDILCGDKNLKWWHSFERVREGLGYSRHKYVELILRRGHDEYRKEYERSVK